MYIGSKNKVKSPYSNPLYIICLSFALIFFIVGSYQALLYENPNSDDSISSYLSDPAPAVNAHVGGDAYNYIINASQATGAFVVSLIFVVLGCTFLICSHLKLLIKTEP